MLGTFFLSNASWVLLMTAIRIPYYRLNTSLKLPDIIQHHYMYFEHWNIFGGTKITLLCVHYELNRQSRISIKGLEDT